MLPAGLWPRIVAVVLAALVASGTALRVGALAPRNVLGAENHARLFSVHSALVLSTAFIALVYFAPSKKASDSVRVTLVLANLFAAVVVVFAGESRAALLVGCGASVVVTVLFTWVVLDSKSWRGALFLIASVAQRGSVHRSCSADRLSRHRRQ
jgi:hypothetical protein